jgi:hypothetical protein
MDCNFEASLRPEKLGAKAGEASSPENWALFKKK